ncbi:glucosamine-6-phosphate deaminase [Wenzhouxiangella sp. AB-CW3]|uniref:glucosamine-6-phosphate deaminase n=1 Tax=Wenzhouxiangella sp. AB-CW3 TaxID=2771012 RepID=UPI00168B7413|nr:glucosamine-6-phosphate deaminase [Wenzhouxiangella sp. AB-CW3]QOC21765.1 glucosamine-6-phosphate deaminase [Wenzhouxiangella sp. AB-CW3]
MRVVILPNAEAVARFGADLVVEQLHTRPDSVLGLATGSTPVALYKRLVQACRTGRVSFSRARTFNLDEYLGLERCHPQSYHQYMRHHLFAHIDIPPEHTALPAGDTEDAFAACEDYERRIRASGGIDLQLLGIGRNGHIGFNEPTSSLGSRTRIKTLTQATIDDNARFYKDDECQPHMAITMGIGTILEARRILLLATGPAKAKAVSRMIEGPLGAFCPASALQLHPDTIVAIDQAAASNLVHGDFYQHVEKEHQQLLGRTGRHSAPLSLPTTKQ